MDDAAQQKLSLYQDHLVDFELTSGEQYDKIMKHEHALLLTAGNLDHRLKVLETQLQTRQEQATDSDVDKWKKQIHDIYIVQNLSLISQSSRIIFEHVVDRKIVKNLEKREKF